jgi:hypothetical protein
VKRGESWDKEEFENGGEITFSDEEVTNGRHEE